MDLLEINKRHPQRPPFQMIERVTEYAPGQSAVGVKAVSVNEPYFAGHFPGMPIMPGVLLTECAAQLCSLVMPGNSDDDRVYVLMKIDNFKFLSPVIPGERLTISVRKTREIAGTYNFSAEITADGVIKAKGGLMFTSMSRKEIYGYTCDQRQSQR